MKILFWVPYPTEGASNRFRVEQYLPYLEEKGIAYSLHPFWKSKAYAVLFKNGCYFKKIYYFIKGSIDRFRDLVNLSDYDLVFVHREAYPIGEAFLEKFIFKKKPIIYDFDDAIFLSASSPQNNFIERFKKPNKVAVIIRKSRHVIVGNRYLANFALRYNLAVSIIPTPIDTDKSYFCKKNPNDEVVIGWIGSVTTLDFLNIMKDAFMFLTKKFSHLKFKIVGGNFSINGLSNIISKPWALEEELEDLKSFDIGIMPMPDNEWTKGKCGFKAILYMNMGIPCVCSPVGANKDIIIDGVNGFFADSQEEWIKKLSLLIENPRLRRDMGIAGRKTVEENFSVKVNAPKFLKVIKKVYNENYRK